jgi:hypothetical protein
LIRESVEWLIARQSEDGYWGSGSVIRQMVCTCQAVMTLIDVGFDPTFEPIDKALKWLKSPQAKNANNSFQRIAPFIAAKVRDKEIKKILTDIRSYIKVGGFGPFPSFSLQMFLLRCLIERGVDLEDPEIKELLKEVLEDQDLEDGGWRKVRKSPTITAFGIWILKILGDNEFNSRIKIALDFIKENKIEKPEPTKIGVCWENNVASTAYIMMDLIAAGLYTKDDMRELIDRAKDYILSNRRDDGSWSPGPPPFGGEVEDAEYFTSIAIRGLVAYNLLGDPQFLQEIHTNWIIESRKKIENLNKRISTLLLQLRVFKLGIISVLLALGLISVRLFVPFTPLISKYYGYLEVIVTVGTIIAWILAFGEKISKWIRGK